jgi:hypothetical protein
MILTLIIWGHSVYTSQHMSGRTDATFVHDTLFTSFKRTSGAKMMCYPALQGLWQFVYVAYITQAALEALHLKFMQNSLTVHLRCPTALQYMY